jgi:hypothetical protein
MHPVIFCKCGSKKVYINGVAVCRNCQKEDSYQEVWQGVIKRWQKKENKSLDKK